MRPILFCLWFCCGLYVASGQRPEEKPDPADVYIAAGDAYWQKKDYVAALREYKKARPLLEDNNEARLGVLLKKIGDVYAAGSYFRQSVDHYRDALVYLRKTGQQALVAECLENMGDINANFGNTTQAINHYTRLLGILTKLEDQKGMARCHNNLSKLYFSEKNYQEALHHNREARQLGGDGRTPVTNASIQEGVILTFMGRLEEAEKSLQEASAMVRLQNIPSQKVLLLSAWSNYYLARQYKARAQLYLDSAKVILKGSQNPEIAIEGLSNLAEISKNNGDYQTAYEAIASMDKFKDIFRSRNIERISAEINEAAQNALNEKEIELKEVQLSKEKLARLTLVRENQLKDSAYVSQTLLLRSLENESALRDTQLAREKSLSRSLNRENALKQQLLNDERRNKNRLYFGLAALLLLGGVIFTQYRKQQKNNKIIHKQKEELAILNKEIHHRVKNNLQVISSMLDLQSQSLSDEKATAVLKEAVLRVQSMAFIHQNLYQDNAVNSVNMTEYIQILSDHLFQTYNIRTDRIQLHTQIEPINLHTDSAIPLGMILNELISNALKYAFKDREQGNLWVVLKRREQELFLQVRDNGVGLPPNFDPDRNNSLGYDIIQAFAQKLRARVHIDGQEGTDVQLRITKFKIIDRI